ncbi:hypothetical protein GCM10009617_09960 [Leifsonia poae]|uniref:Uncharacterized protein n=1 Tax=Leifsonia poae TaxID=110933 RepID=A0A9W6H894_9MICO|nr:hypothetical protein GCM10017584_06710 [Leifsonia poae]
MPPAPSIAASARQSTKGVTGGAEVGDALGVVTGAVVAGAGEDADDEDGELGMAAAATA